MSGESAFVIAYQKNEHFQKIGLMWLLTQIQGMSLYLCKPSSHAEFISHHKISKYNLMQ